SFMGKIKDYGPFTKSGYFKEYYLVFDAYKCAKNSLKLDVWFTKNGNAALVFWNTTISGLDGRTILAEKLESIGLLEEFENKPSHNDNGYKKEFILGTGFQTIQEVDKAVFEFVDQFFIKLRESQ
ncbi:MAG TPA: hypothetical protein PKY12_10735, partial [Catalimonadaceae bacterium]|nr:hypothetical protein [Catalimonadaceae bacterium]